MEMNIALEREPVLLREIKLKGVTNDLKEEVTIFWQYLHDIVVPVGMRLMIEVNGYYLEECDREGPHVCKGDKV